MSHIITDLGEAKLAQAAGDETEVAISYIALGDANGVAYDPDYSQTTLINERVRQPIESRIFQGDGSWAVKAIFGADTESFDVREIGFFDQDGDLIALFAGVDMIPRQTGVIEYVAKHILNFSRVADGLIVVNAPDDDLYLLALTTAHSNACSIHRNLEQDILIRANARTARDNATAITENERRRRNAL